MSIATSAFFTSETGAVTAPVPIASISAATDDAWHILVQWSTLLFLKPVLTSFWNKYASSLEPFAQPNPARALSPPLESLMEDNFLAARSSASSHDASLK